MPSLEPLLVARQSPEHDRVLRFYVGIVTVIWVVALIAVRSLAAARAEPTEP